MWLKKLKLVLPAFLIKVFPFIEKKIYILKIKPSIHQGRWLSFLLKNNFSFEDFFFRILNREQQVLKMIQRIEKDGVSSRVRKK